MTKIEKISDRKYTPEEIQACINVLTLLVKENEQLAHLTKEERVALMRMAGHISRPDREEVRKRASQRRHLKQQRRDEHERRLRAETGIRKAREAAVFVAPLQIEAPKAPVLDEELVNPRSCYV